MLVQVFIICFLLTAASAEPAAIASADVIRPRAISPDVFNQRLNDLWTADKLRAAVPLDVILSKQTTKSMPNNNDVLVGPQSNVSGSIPASDGPKTKAISANGRQVATTGRVFWQVGGSSYTCSAAIVSSKSGDLISTAGHCVYDTEKKIWYNNHNWVFVPAYNNGKAPYGVWSMRRFLALQAWTNSADFNHDVSFVAVSMVSGKHIQSYLGSQGIGFNMPRLASTYAFGYPSNINSGLTLQQCSGVTTKSKWTQNNFQGQGLSCAMGPGCSGGPWLQNVADSTGIGYVTSVNSFTISNVPNVMNGPYFDSNTKFLYDSATSM